MYDKPKVTIDLDEYQDLQKVKQQLPAVAVVNALKSSKSTTLVGAISEVNMQLQRLDQTIEQNGVVLKITTRLENPADAFRATSAFDTRMR